jgi:hypothetical protein
LALNGFLSQVMVCETTAATTRIITAASFRFASMAVLSLYFQQEHTDAALRRGKAPLTPFFLGLCTAQWNHCKGSPLFKREGPSLLGLKMKDAVPSSPLTNP